MQCNFHLIKWNLYICTIWSTDSLNFTALKSGKMPEKVNCGRDTFLENTQYCSRAIKDKPICRSYLAQMK